MEINWSRVVWVDKTRDINDKPQTEAAEDQKEADATSEPSSVNHQEAKEKPSVDQEIQEKWEKEQTDLKNQLVLEDRDPWAVHRVTKDNEEEHTGVSPLVYIGGVDISFVKGDEVNACAALVVLNFPELEVVYEDMQMIELTQPYIPGFLAFREAPFLVDMVNTLQNKHPKLKPQVIMVDGNGILHTREFGLASHLGVLLDMPTIGVAKNLFQVQGLEKNDEHKNKIKTELLVGGDTFPLVGDTGRTLGMALRSVDSAPNPVYVSQGHSISLDTAVWVVTQCSRYRVPEPVRQADLRSREYLRDNWRED